MKKISELVKTWFEWYQWYFLQHFTKWTNFTKFLGSAIPSLRFFLGFFPHMALTGLKWLFLKMILSKQGLPQKNGEVSSTRSLKRLASKVLMQSMRWNEKNQPTVATSYMTIASCMWGQKPNATFLEAEIERKKTPVCMFVEHVVFCIWFQISVTWLRPPPPLWCFFKWLVSLFSWQVGCGTGELTMQLLPRARKACWKKVGSKGVRKKVHIMNSGIPPPHPKKFVLFGHHSDFDVQTWWILAKFTQNGHNMSRVQ